MLTNPKQVVELGFVQNLYNPDKQIQPNAIDFDVDTIQQLHTNLQVVITDDSKVMCHQVPVEAKDGMFHLAANQEYDISSKVYVEVPEGKAAILVLRSTFVRNGLWLASGLYDSGFKGNIGAVLHTGNNSVILARGTRIGQIIFIESDSAGMYAGGYNTINGVHWKEAKGS